MEAANFGFFNTRAWQYGLLILVLKSASFGVGPFAAGCASRAGNFHREPVSFLYCSSLYSCCYSLSLLLKAAQNCQQRQIYEPNTEQECLGDMQGPNVELVPTSKDSMLIFPVFPNERTNS